MNLSRRTSITAVCALAATPALSQPPRPLRVVASFSILADMARNVGGDDVNVAALVGSGVDAHVFQPSPADARRLAEADLVLVNGLGFEGWLDRLVRASGYRGTIAVASDGITARKLGSATDPHAWQDLGNAKRYAENLRDAMSRARPDRKEAFARRCAVYNQSLQALDQEVRARFNVLPRSLRRVITSHDAFAYFGASYGVEFLAPQGMNTDTEASAAAVARLVDQIRSQKVRAVFVENISDPRLVQRIAREGGAIVGGRLYSDALSPPGTEADTYLRLFSHNAKTIASALSESPR
jgi:zinc/manganese transport system substrate-binding protein